MGIHKPSGERERVAVLSCAREIYVQYGAHVHVSWLQQPFQPSLCLLLPSYWLLKMVLTSRNGALRWTNDAKCSGIGTSREGNVALEGLTQATQICLADSPALISVL
jgi:hypothetical protein